MAIFLGDKLATGISKLTVSARAYGRRDGDGCLLVVVALGDWATERLGELESYLDEYSFLSGQRVYSLAAGLRAGEASLMDVSVPDGDFSEVGITVLGDMAELDALRRGGLRALEELKRSFEEAMVVGRVRLCFHGVFNDRRRHANAGLRSELLRLTRSGVIDRVYHPLSTRVPGHGERALRNIAFTACFENCVAFPEDELRDKLSLLVKEPNDTPLKTGSYPYYVVNYERFSLLESARIKYCYDVLSAQCSPGSGESMRRELPELVRSLLAGFLVTGASSLDEAVAELSEKAAARLGRLPFLPVKAGALPAEETARRLYGVVNGVSGAERYLEENVLAPLRKGFEAKEDKYFGSRLIASCPNTGYVRRRLLSELADIDDAALGMGGETAAEPAAVSTVAEAARECCRLLAARALRRCAGELLLRLRDRLRTWLSENLDMGWFPALERRLGDELQTLREAWERKNDGDVARVPPVVRPDALPCSDGDPLGVARTEGFASLAERELRSGAGASYEGFIRRCNNMKMLIAPDFNMLRLDVFLANRSLMLPPERCDRICYDDLMDERYLSCFSVSICLLSDLIDGYSPIETEASKYE